MKLVWAKESLMELHHREEIQLAQEGRLTTRMGFISCGIVLLVTLLPFLVN